MRMRCIADCTPAVLRWQDDCFRAFVGSILGMSLALNSRGNLTQWEKEEEKSVPKTEPFPFIFNPFRLIIRGWGENGKAKQIQKTHTKRLNMRKLREHHPPSFIFTTRPLQTLTAQPNRKACCPDFSTGGTVLSWPCVTPKVEVRYSSMWCKLSKKMCFPIYLWWVMLSGKRLS